MCMVAAPLVQSKPVANVVNMTPIGAGYKQASGGQKLSDSVKDGSIYTGLAGVALINRQNKSNQFSTAG